MASRRRQLQLLQRTKAAYARPLLLNDLNMVLPQISVTGLDFFTCVYARSWPVALTFLDQASPYEALRLLDQIDRKDLADLLGACAACAGAVNVAKVKLFAEVVLTRKVPANRPTELLGNNDAAAFIAQASPLLIYQDPTWTLPAAAPSSRTLTPNDYASAAATLGVDEATVRTVATVEAGGRSGFGDDGRCKIRYELHTFKDFTAGAYTATHPHLSNTYSVGKLKAFHHGNSEEWSHLYGAAMLRRTDEGIKASSWGMFQIMGHNHAPCGYPTPGTFASAMCNSAGDQLKAFVNFCSRRHLTKYLKKKDWAGFAEHYNGPSYRDNKYDEHLAAAYARYSATAQSK